MILKLFDHNGLGPSGLINLLSKAQDLSKSFQGPFFRVKKYFYNSVVYKEGLIRGLSTIMEF